MSERLPLWKNVRWPQLLFGALFALLIHPLLQHATGAAPLSPGGVTMRVIALVVLLLVFVVYLQNVHRFGLVPDYSLKCRFCNGPVNRYSEFCEHCGGDLIAEEKLIPCPKCGVELVEGTRFCPECGSSTKKTKGKKGKSPPPPTTVDTREAGWSTPVDAVSGFPPDDR